MSDLVEALREWFLGWFVRESIVDGQGVQRTFEHSWPWPPWITLLVVIVVVVSVLVMYSRESTARRARLLGLATIRCLLVCLVLFMMYGWMQHRHRTELPEVVVAVDASESMAFVDRYDDKRLKRLVASYVAADPSRLKLAKALLTSDSGGWLQDLQGRYQVKLVRLGDASQRLTADSDNGLDVIRKLEATGKTSRLGRGLREVLDAQRGRSTAAVILLTDGINTDGPTISEAATYARHELIPLYVVGLGSEEPPSDVRISDLLVDDVVFVNDVLIFDAQLHSHGLSGRDAVVRLVRTEDGATLAEKTVQLPKDDESLPVRLSYRPREEGEFEHAIEVEPLADETNHENNRIVRQISVRDATVRVLLVQASPSYEFRFLKNLLSRARQPSAESKSAIELTVILQEADIDFAAQDEIVETVFPVQREELFDFDVLIFGDANPAFLSRSVMENIAAFVQDRGGGVIFVAGPRHVPQDLRGTPIESLMPFDLETATLAEQDALADDEFNVRPTTLGVQHPILQLGDSDQETRDVWNSLPRVRWMLEAPDVNTTAMVLLEHPTRRNLVGGSLPVLLMQFVGAGKVVFQTIDETYLWARHHGSDRYHARYWMQMIRYLGRSKLAADQFPAEVTTDMQQYLTNEPVRLRVRFRDDRLAPATEDGVTVAITDLKGRSTPIVLRRRASSRGLFEAAVTNLSAGEYEARLATPALEQQPPLHRFSVESRTSEQATMQMNAVDLNKASRITGGRFYTIASASHLPGDLPSGNQVRVDSLPPKPIWNSSWLAALFVVLIATEWTLRKRAGLL